jgi:hypothetical protein
MKSDEKRSIRLNILFKRALAGADRDELMDKAMTWVTRKTAEEYIDSVVILLKKRGKTV